MKIISNIIEKDNYRIIENRLFNKGEADPNKVIKKKFNNIQQYDHSWLGYQGLFDDLKSKFSDKYPEFCISPAKDSEPIFLMDFKKDTLNEYYGVLNYPKNLELEFTDVEVGLSITNERLYFYNIQQNWCLFADRYNDILILKY